MVKIRIIELRTGALLLALGLLAFGCQSQVKTETEPAPKTTETAPLVESRIVDVALEDFQELLDREGMQVLDVRTDGEVAEGTIGSAVHVNIHGAGFAEKAAKMLDKAGPVAVYCKAGGRSANASARLQELGFKEIYNYTGGMDEWKAEGLPTTTK